MRAQTARSVEAFEARTASAAAAGGLSPRGAQDAACDGEVAALTEDARSAETGEGEALVVALDRASPVVPTVAVVVRTPTRRAARPSAARVHGGGARKQGV